MIYDRSRAITSRLPCHKVERRERPPRPGGSRQGNCPKTACAKEGAAARIQHAVPRQRRRPRAKTPPRQAMDAAGRPRRCVLGPRGQCEARARSETEGRLYRTCLCRSAAGRQRPSNALCLRRSRRAGRQRPMQAQSFPATGCISSTAWKRKMTGTASASWARAVSVRGGSGGSGTVVKRAHCQRPRLRSRAAAGATAPRPRRRWSAARHGRARTRPPASA